MVWLKQKTPKLFLDIHIGYNGKEYAGRLDLSKEIKENGKMDWDKFERRGNVLMNAGRRRLQKEGAVEYYRDDDGKELVS